MIGSPIAADALTLCEGFGSSAFTVGGHAARGLLDDLDAEIDPYSVVGQTSKQRQRAFRVATARVTAFGIATQSELVVTNDLTGDAEQYRVGDTRRESDGAVTVLFLKAVT